LTDDSLQSADKDQQASIAVARKPHVRIRSRCKVYTYRNLQRHRMFLSATARLSCTGNALISSLLQTSFIRWHAALNARLHRREAIGVSPATAVNKVQTSFALCVVVPGRIEGLALPTISRQLTQIYQQIQQNAGAVKDFILPHSAVYLRIQK